MDDSSIWLALFLTTIAGLSTGIGGLIAFGAKSTDERFLSFRLDFLPASWCMCHLWR